MDDRYTPRPTSSSRKINEAVQHTSSGSRTLSTTDAAYDAESKRKFDENYEEIFGKRELRHGV
jgi:hypothetical protein